jgi:hypothetical protein
MGVMKRPTDIAHARKKRANRTTRPSKELSKSAPAISAEDTKQLADIVQVRERIVELVKGSAADIVTELIDVAKLGQVAPAKYLFELVGLYPASEGTELVPPEESLAHTLLTRLGLPTEPVVRDQDQVPAALTTSCERRGTPANDIHSLGCGKRPSSFSEVEQKKSAVDAVE